ncbi:coiled-coil domain-containing protein mad1 [Conoideocrella luteorostrata]|uniref:Spindle assembly checkpoint component MAD1 n=1 Tax=Conoideocrella luteorostrata TaxID=1105319 RepID=A0AAJ0CZG3_9HYPO|nr:coiled-coil domain-containing protein mad1 [Conoideocrella luteorostrata]
MRGRTPQDGEAAGTRGLQSTMSSRMRASASSALPRAPSRSRIASFRATQPTYNLITGGDANVRPSSRQSQAGESVRPGSRDSSKENMAPPDADEYEKYRKEIEALKAEIGTLQYRMQTAEQETAIALSQQSNKMEQARRREQEELHQRQTAEAEQAKSAGQVESVKAELEELKERSESEAKALERKAREYQDEARLLQEQLEDLSTAKDDAARIADKKLNDMQLHITALQNSLEEVEQENQARDDNVQQAHSIVAEKENHIAKLEADVLRLKAQSGDAETMQIIKKELTEQVQHIRALEATNRDQLSELKHLRAINKAVEVVEEEKRTLQRKLEAAESLEAELAEARLQRQRLEDEQLAWTAYLKSSSDMGDKEFDSPEAMARALVEERLTTATYVEQLGVLRAEMAAQQNKIQSLQDERAQLKEQVENARTSAGALSTDKARMRIDRQRVLALKEVEYLRAQMKAFDDEDQTMQPDQYDETRAAQIRELEALIDNYKTEVQNLHSELSSAEPSAGTPTVQNATGSKRSRSEDDDAQEQIGQLSRKNRMLQEEVTNLHTKVTMLEKDLSANKEQLSAAKDHSSTRILSLRSNPTSDFEAIKRSTLKALKVENSDLLAQLRSRDTNSAVPVIPTSVLGAMEREVAAAKAETASAQKSAKRLKEVWGSKSQEFKEAIFSTLGWTVTFIPNGKMRVESTFFPSQTDENENSIVFDGERGTMKVGGGPKSPFARRIGDQIGFWVREKGCIPGFLAALTLEFYEEHTKAARN